MIKEKLETAELVLRQFSCCCMDNGTGDFLNAVYYQHLKMERPDFTKFNIETWVRARRTILSKYPELDLRTSKTIDVEAKIKNELKSI